MSLGIPDQAYVLDGTTRAELCPQILLTHDERQVPNENCASEVLPWVHTGVATAARDLLVFTFLLNKTLTTRVHSQVSLLKQHLIELDFSCSCTTWLSIENVSILVILELSELLLDNFGALRLLSVFGDANGAEPDFLDFPA